MRKNIVTPFRKKKSGHLESELDTIVSQKIDPYLFGIIVNHFLVRTVDRCLYAEMQHVKKQLISGQ